MAERDHENAKIYALGGTKVYVLVDDAEVPKDGRSLCVSLHGGGGPGKQQGQISNGNFNDWKTHQKIFAQSWQKGHVHVAPLTPSSAWNQWHLPHIDYLVNQILKVCISQYQVNPNKVTFIGYSAGGDGMYRLAARIPDRFSTACAWAGHPGNTNFEALRNVNFCLAVGEDDTAYSRSDLVKKNTQVLLDLQKQHGGYNHKSIVVEGKGHNVVQECIDQIPWISEQRRNPYPDHITWIQGDVFHSRCYWLSIPGDDSTSLGFGTNGDLKDNPTQIIQSEQMKPGQKIEVKANFGENTIEVIHSDTSEVTFNFNDSMGFDLDKEITIKTPQKEEKYKVVRTIANIYKTFAEYGDKSLTFSAQITIKLDQ